MKIISLLFCSVVLVSGVPQKETYLLPERSEVVTVNAGQPNPIPYQ